MSPTLIAAGVAAAVTLSSLGYATFERQKRRTAEAELVGARAALSHAVAVANENAAAEAMCRTEATRAGVALNRLDELREQLRRATEAETERLLNAPLEGPSPLDRVLGVPSPSPSNPGPGTDQPVGNPGVPVPPR